MRGAGWLALALLSAACAQDLSLGEVPLGERDAGAPLLADELAAQLADFRREMKGEWVGTQQIPFLARNPLLSSLPPLPSLRVRFGDELVYQVSCEGGCGDYDGPFPFTGEERGSSALPDGHIGRYAVTTFAHNGEAWGRTLDEVDGVRTRAELNRMRLSRDGTQLSFQRVQVDARGRYADVLAAEVTLRRAP